VVRRTEEKSRICSLDLGIHAVLVRDEVNPTCPGSRDQEALGLKSAQANGS
jgi:hypothetical protein